MMKVVYISSSIFPSTQANNVHVTSMCNAIYDEGNEVILIAYCLKKNDIDSIIRSIYSDYNLNRDIVVKLVVRKNNYGSSYFSAFEISKLISTIGPNLIISRNFLASYCSRKYCKKLFLELHQPIKFGLGLQFYLLKRLSKRNNFKGLIVISNPLKEIFINYGLSKNIVFVLPDGASLPEEECSIDSIITSDRLKVGYFGSLYSGRGVELILDLARLLPEMDFYIYGASIVQLEVLNSKNYNLNNLVFVGHIPFAKVSIEMQRMHVLLAPYQRKVGLVSGNLTTESWMSPLKIFEYMSVERAIVCSNIPVLQEVLVDGVNCILCFPEDINDWYLALKKLDSNRGELVKIAKRGRFDLIQYYSWKVRWQNIKNLIK
jgi:glycosyltransferase involved in cell wall biosynthesis